MDGAGPEVTRPYPQKQHKKGPQYIIDVLKPERRNPEAQTVRWPLSRPAPERTTTY